MARCYLEEKSAVSTSLPYTGFFSTFIFALRSMLRNPLLSQSSSFHSPSSVFWQEKNLRILIGFPCPSRGSTWEAERSKPRAGCSVQWKSNFQAHIKSWTLSPTQKNYFPIYLTFSFYDKCIYQELKTATNNAWTFLKISIQWQTSQTIHNLIFIAWPRKYLKCS